MKPSPKPTLEQTAAATEFAGYSPEQAKAAIATMKASSEFWDKYSNSAHPGNKLAIASWHEAHKRAYPN